MFGALAPWATTAAWLALAAALAASVFGWLAGPSLLRAWQRRRLAAQPFPAAWRRVLQQRLPVYRRLAPAQQQRLRRHVQWMLAHTPFIGCAGLVVQDEHRVLIAAQAALLLLGRPAGRFAGLRQVLVYPGAFVVQRPQPGEGGLVHEGRRVLGGESWQQGQVLLSWDDVLRGAADPDDGHNVVVHEFAHQLDQEKGGANGAPWQAGRAQVARWAAVLSAEFEALRARLARGETGLIDPYGAENPAEFFAVLSEHFIEQPALLAQAHPALYNEFVRVYRTDPRHWY